MDERDLVRKHVEALLEEAGAAGVPDDTIGRLLLDATIELWRRARSHEDIAAELEFTAENLDPDTEFPFMRP